MQSLGLHAWVCNGHFKKSPQVIYMYVKAEESKTGTEFIHTLVNHVYGPDWEGLPFGVDEGKLGLQWKHGPKKDNPVLIGLAIRRGKEWTV